MLKTLTRLVLFSAVTALSAELANSQVGYAYEAKALVKSIKEKASRACFALNKSGADLDLVPITETDFTVEWGVDSVYEVQITAEGKMATIVYEDYRCPNNGVPACGSGGCSFYVLVDDAVFFYLLGGRPYTVVRSNAVQIIVPIGGYACKDSDGTSVTESEPCQALLTWSEAEKDFFSTTTDLRRVSVVE